jgi:hypothetical protein
MVLRDCGWLGRVRSARHKRSAGGMSEHLPGRPWAQSERQTRGSNVGEESVLGWLVTFEPAHYTGRRGVRVPAHRTRGFLAAYIVVRHRERKAADRAG